MASGVYNALESRRTIQPIPTKSRRRCCCGCGKRATHMMMADGCCMSTGCELLARRWVRNPVDAWLTRCRTVAKDSALLCTCPPADKGHAYGKITPGCPVHAVPVDNALFNLPGDPHQDGGGDE